MFTNKEVFNINNITKKAYTLPEIIIATFISVLIISFIFVFLSNILESIGSTKREVRFLSSFYDFTYKLNNYKNIYNTGGILVDNIDGSDIFLMEDTMGEKGILFGPVKFFDSKISVDSQVYEDKGIGFRKVSQAEMTEIKSDVSVIYNYSFQRDHIFYDINIQDIYITKYNSGYIYDLNLIVDLDFNVNLTGQLRDDLKKDTLKKFNINF